jgi:hypothetical protein
MDQARIQSGADTGLLELVRSAATAVSGAKRDPVGRLEIARVGEASGIGQLCVDASVSAHGLGWTVDQLDVKAQWETHAPLPKATLFEVLEQFGSNQFVNFTVLDGPVELMDFTLSFSSRLPVLAANQLIAHDALQADRVALCAGVLDRLGVGVSVHRGVLRVRRHQLRARVKLAALVDAFQMVTTGGLPVVLYTSTLPAVQAVRIAQGPQDARGTPLDVCISSGTQRERVETVERILREAFDVGFGDQAWQVRNAHGRPEDFRARGVVPQRPRRTWSLNWGQRRA